MGTTAQLNEFLARTEKRAYAMAMVAVRNPEDALDIVQDVMLTLARKYAGKPSDQWPPLFYRILRNRITDFHRASKVRKRIFGWFNPGRDDEPIVDPIDNAQGPERDTPDHRLHIDGARTEIVAALARLPARQQEVFMLRAWEGLDVKSTARAMGCGEGSVKTHYSRAVHALRDELQEFQND